MTVIIPRGFQEVNLSSLKRHYLSSGNAADEVSFARRLRKCILPGFRVEFLGSPDESITVLPNTWGTVTNVDDLGMVFIELDAGGGGLGLDFNDDFMVCRPVPLVFVKLMDLEKVSF